MYDMEVWVTRCKMVIIKKVKDSGKMDGNTIVLICLLAASLSWWMAIHIKEEVRLLKQRKRDELVRAERERKVRALYE